MVMQLPCTIFSLELALDWERQLCLVIRGSDDQTALKVVDGTVEVVSEGHWK